MFSDLSTWTREFSLFSCRPDNVVVRQRALGVVLIVKVKKPAEDVFSNKSGAGYIFDSVFGQTSLLRFFLHLMRWSLLTRAIESRQQRQEILERSARNLHMKFDPPGVVKNTVVSFESSAEAALSVGTASLPVLSTCASWRWMHGPVSCVPASVAMAT